MHIHRFSAGQLSSSSSSTALDSSSGSSETKATHHHHHHHAKADKKDTTADSGSASQSTDSSSDMSDLIDKIKSTLQTMLANAGSQSTTSTTSPSDGTVQDAATGTDASSTTNAGTSTTATGTTSNTATGTTTASGTSGVKLGVPSYSYTGPQTFWDQVQNAKPGSIFILNPDSGPGQTADPTYKAAVEAAHAKGVKIYGYVRTQYGDRSETDVKSDISSYQKMYGVDGVFLDEAQLDKSHLSYYKDISDGLHASGLEVAANPGQPDIDQDAVNFTDHIMNFEGSYADYQKADFPEWTKSVSPDKFWNVVYDTPSNVNVQDVLNTAEKNNAGYIYATDDTIESGNPWDNVPSFFKQEMALTA